MVGSCKHVNEVSGIKKMGIVTSFLRMIPFRFKLLMGVTMKLTNYTAAHAGTYSELYNL